MDKTDDIYLASLLRATLIVPIQGAKDEKRLKEFLNKANIHFYDVYGDEIVSEYKDIYWEEAIDIDRKWLAYDDPSLQFYYTKGMVSVDEVYLQRGFEDTIDGIPISLILTMPTVFPEFKLIEDLECISFTKQDGTEEWYELVGYDWFDLIEVKE
jgi:hypothetical protein